MLLIKEELYIQHVILQKIVITVSLTIFDKTIQQQQQVEPYSGTKWNLNNLKTIEIITRHIMVIT